MSQYTVIFQGHLGCDPERKQTSSGQEYVDMRIAHKFNRGNENRVAVWHRCSIWSGISDKMINSLKKGSHVHVVGTLRNVSCYLNKENEPSATNDVNILSISYVDSSRYKSGAELEDKLEEVQIGEAPF